MLQRAVAGGWGEEGRKGWAVCAVCDVCCATFSGLMSPWIMLQEPTKASAVTICHAILRTKSIGTR